MSIAQSLLERGGDVVVVAAGEVRGDAAIAARRSFTGEVMSAGAKLTGDVFVDCLFGSGLSRQLSDDHVALLHALADAHRVSIAIDVPSGIAADSGALLACALPDYDLTVALGAWKLAHFLSPASAKMGTVHLVEIGVSDQPGAARRLCRPSLVAPAVDAQKYRRGLVMVVGGEMPGAAALAAEACARGGAGYVRLSTAQSARASHAIVQTRETGLRKGQGRAGRPWSGTQRSIAHVARQCVASGRPGRRRRRCSVVVGEDGIGHDACACDHDPA